MFACTRPVAALLAAVATSGLFTLLDLLVRYAGQ